MNEYQRINILLDALLGAAGRAMWLASRVDGKTAREIAREHKTSVGRVREVLASCDWAIESAGLVAPPEAKRPLRTNWSGFHQSEDV